MRSPKEWLDSAEVELGAANTAWRDGLAGRGRVGARRAAGMALKAWLDGSPSEAYGVNFMHHLNALADDPAQPDAVRESAWRLAARKTPDTGFVAELPSPLTPGTDAARIITWVRVQIAN